MTKLIEKPQPSFPEAVRKGCNRLFDFHGRTRRSDFWWFMLAFMVCNLILTNIWEAFLPPLAAVICNLAVLSLALAITVRRLQDRGASKWWVFANYISTAVYTLYNYGTGIGEELMSVNASPEASMSMLTDPILIISLIVFMVTDLVTFVYCVLDGKPEPNKYGTSPKYIIKEEATEEQHPEAIA